MYPLLEEWHDYFNSSQLSRRQREELFQLSEKQKDLLAPAKKDIDAASLET